MCHDLKLPFMNKHNTKYWLMDTEFTSTFKEYVLPDAVTRFRQGLGRLIRHEDDKGLIVSFDDRLVNSNFKISLPKPWRIIARKREYQTI